VQVGASDKQAAVSPQQLSQLVLYAAVGGTVAYCVLAELRTSRVLRRCGERLERLRRLLAPSPAAASKSTADMIARARR
jgi:hypothetical protein